MWDCSCEEIRNLALNCAQHVVALPAKSELIYHLDAYHKYAFQVAHCDPIAAQKKSMKETLILSAGLLARALLTDQ
jgi:hypothetical protein